MNTTALHNHLESSNKQYVSFNQDIAELQSYLASGDLSANEVIKDGMDEVWSLLKDWFSDKISDQDSVDSLFENLDFSNQIAYLQSQVTETRSVMS